MGRFSRKSAHYFGRRDVPYWIGVDCCQFSARTTGPIEAWEYYKSSVRTGVGERDRASRGPYRNPVPWDEISPLCSKSTSPTPLSPSRMAEGEFCPFTRSTRGRASLMRTNSLCFPERSRSIRDG